MASSELNNWKMRLGVSHRKHKPYEEARNMFKRYYRGDQWIDNDISNRFLDLVVDNIVFQNVRAIVPRLNLRRPRIFVTPTKPPYNTKQGMVDTNTGAMALEVLLEWYYKHLRVHRSTRKCLYDTLIGFWGILEFGYTLTTEKVYVRNNKRELLNVDEIIRENEVFVKRRNPDDFRRDPEGEDHLLEDDRWIALRFCHSLKDIKQNSLFENTRNLKSNFTMKTDYGANTLSEKNQINIDMSFGKHDPEIFERVEGWWIWDKKLRRRMAVVDEHDKFLANAPFPDWMDNIEGFPVEVMYLNENPDEAMPVGDIEIYKKAQDEINQIGSYQLAHIRKISQRKYVANDQMDETEDVKLQHGPDGTVIRVKGNPGEKIMALQDASISQDIYIVQKQKKMEASAAANVPEQDRGFSRNFETATEPALINAGSQTIRQDQRGLFEGFINRSIAKMAKIIQKTLDSKISVPLDQGQFDRLIKAGNNPNENPQTINFIASKLGKIVGDKDQIYLQPWFNLESKDIKGDYDYTIEVGSTAPINQEVRKRDAGALAQILANNPYINQREATKKILEAFERKDIEEFLKSEEQVRQEQAAAAQAAMQGEKEKSSDKIKADLLKTQMKSQTALQVSKDKRASALEVAITKSLEGKRQK
jgi:hypothetical protein